MVGPRALHKMDNMTTVTQIIAEFGGVQIPTTTIRRGSLAHLCILSDLCVLGG